MAGPRITFPNLLAQGTILPTSGGAGTHEIAYPYNNVFHRLLSKPWRTNYQTFTITANNNKLDFSTTNGGGSALVATIALGDYRGEELATEISTKMNAAAVLGQKDISCLYNRANKSFTFGKLAGYLYILWATGANKNNGIGTTLQFITWVDSIVASGLGGSETGELDARSTGGLYHIDSTNNKIYYVDVSSRTATIPVATYTAKELAAEIKYQMDTTSSITNNHCNNYPTLYGAYRWRLGKQSGTFTLTLSNTTNAIWDTLGYVTGSDRSGSQSYTSDYTRIHSGASSGDNEGEGIVIDFGAATTLRFVSVAGSNVQAAGTGGTLVLRIQASSTDSWSSATFTDTAPVTFFDRVNKKSWFYWDFGVDRTFRYWRFSIVNNDNPDGFVQISALNGTGPITTLGSNYNWGARMVQDIITDKAMTDMGTIYGNIRTAHLEVDLQFQKITQADKNALDALISVVADINPFGILLDATGNTMPKFLWATFAAIPEFEELAPGPGGSIWTCSSFVLREAT